MKTTKTMMAVVAIVLASGITGCVTEPTTATMPAPTQHQMEVAVGAYIQSVFKDPNSVQDLTISTPVWGVSGMDTIGGMAVNDWMIPFSCNAKNSFGGYTGVTRHYIAWNGGIDWAAQQRLGSYLQ